MNDPHCNTCPKWQVRDEIYNRGWTAQITVCTKYHKQLYYLWGEENRTPHICDECKKRFAYVPYI